VVFFLLDVPCKKVFEVHLSASKPQIGICTVSKKACGEMLPSFTCILCALQEKHGMSRFALHGPDVSFSPSPAHHPSHLVLHIYSMFFVRQHFYWWWEICFVPLRNR